jgi:hypothetical protein
MISTIPFSGFYNSVHESQIDDAIEQMFTDRDTGCNRNEGLEYALFRKCDYSGVFNAYAAEYAENFCEEFCVKGKFESMSSPREYNFTTDRIFITIEEADAREILKRVDPATLAKVAKLMFTSRDGFISSYSPKVESWGDLLEWDHNQLGALMIALAGSDFDQYSECNLMESAQCNGKYESWISENTPGIERLYKIHEYLEARSHR